MSDRHSTDSAGTLLIDQIVGVPLDSTGRYEGCQLMPGALRHAGLLPDADVDTGNLQVGLADPRRHPVTHITSFDDLLAASRVIRDATYDLARRGRTPLLLGGDCSILIGIMNGLRLHDPDVGLVMIDGHFDMHTPLTSESGDAADMEITLLTDPRSPFSSLGSNTVPLTLDRIAFLGPRDHDEMTKLGSLLPHEMTPRPYIADQQTLTHTTVSDAAAMALEHLHDAGTSGYWVHVDLDVLTTQDMPAVDYPQPGGLSWDELTAAIGVLLRSPGFRGLSVAILNPNLDKDGTAAKRVATWLNSVLIREQDWPRIQR